MNNIEKSLLIVLSYHVSEPSNQHREGGRRVKNMNLPSCLNTSLPSFVSANDNYFLRQFIKQKGYGIVLSLANMITMAHPELKPYLIMDALTCWIISSHNRFKNAQRIFHSYKFFWLK